MTSILTLQSDQTGYTTYAKPSPYVSSPTWGSDAINGTSLGAGQYSFATDDSISYVYFRQLGGSKANTDEVLGTTDGDRVPLSGTATSTNIGQFAPAATISGAFVSTGDLDFTDDTYTATVFRNGATSGLTATLGTVTATVLPYSYLLPGSFVAGDTGRIVLTNATGDLIAVHRFGVSTLTPTPKNISIEDRSITVE